MCVQFAKNADNMQTKALNGGPEPEAGQSKSHLMYQFRFHLAYSIYLSVLGLYLNSLKYDHYADSRVRIYEFLRFRLSTVWIHVALLVYFPVASYCDWRALRGEGFLRHVRTLDSARRLAFTALIFPSTWYVDSFFWRIWCLDRELIVPAYLDELMPPKMQHALHTVSLLVVTVELMLVQWKRPRSLLRNHVVLSAYLALYFLVVIETKINVGTWPYPFMGVIVKLHRRVLYVVSYVVEHYFFFFTQWAIIETKQRHAMLKKIQLSEGKKALMS